MTTTQVAPKVEAKPEVKVNVSFVKSYSEVLKTKELGEAKTASKYAKCVRLIQSEKIPRSEVVASLMAEPNNIPKASAEVTASRMFTLAKPENEELLKKLEAGADTVRNTYKNMTKKQQNPRLNNEAKLQKYLALAVAVANAMQLSSSIFADRALEAFNIQSKEGE